MKAFLLLFLIMIASTALYSQDDNSFREYKKYFKQLEYKRGSHCQNTSSVFLKMRNTSQTTMDIQYAIEDESGLWHTGIIQKIKPGEDTGDLIVYCNSSGRYKWWARPSFKATSLSFPSEEKLNQRTKQ